MSKQKLICPECQEEKKVLIELVFIIQGTHQNVEMCHECYEDLKEIKSQTGTKIPRILYRRTKNA